MNSVKNADGSLAQFMPKVNGKTFVCPDCGCNVFHKPDDTRPFLYQCNGCDAVFSGQAAKDE
jgi:predicted RNA-binding Zn-ribbon protein involved in translation (DUF1610 family)